AGNPDDARQWLIDAAGIPREAAVMIVDYLAAGRAALGAMPTQHQLVLERFFDDTGGMQLVVHSPYGGRINRALGLALRKKFCRALNFELQAAATDDAIVLSLGLTHSFPLEDVSRYLSSRTVADTLEHAILDAPMFQVARGLVMCDGFAAIRSLIRVRRTPSAGRPWRFSWLR